ncbi:T9SS type A sorting domain-containing protein [Arundinibacter roseus]|uniref:T9SS type A sorting domain-containing protein n=1 Tax=Arundinibacter roseus TaxID=2070510 RepID=A0A4R4KIW0_9BACT|nr:T9SS type A sorting domain-containing protein [Arundinibacter roseus]TDB68197.1 T9SS type A sorting domain-containing protein [Arundinibacter roseus]
MKRTILFTYILLTLGWGVAHAQAPANRSRLNMAYQKQPASLDRPALVQKPAVIEYKPLALQKPLALTNYYRALLFTNPAQLAPASADSQASANSALVERSERRTLGFEEKSRGVEEQLYSSDRINVSNIYPNPASEYAEIDYAVTAPLRDAKVIIYNVLGSQVAEYTLDKSDRKLRVNTREMPTGVYFYQLSIEGKKVATKKMLVRHQQ